MLNIPRREHRLYLSSIDNHFFFAVSIVTTTGLAPESFSNVYNFYGELISLVFMQLGGIGYMAIVSFLLLKKKKNLPKLSARLLREEFQLPQKYPLRTFLLSVIIYTIFFQVLGSIILYINFNNQGIDQPLWSSIFHATSAFCTAGFSLFDNSFIDQIDSGQTVVVFLLSMLGSIGFIVFVDVQNAWILKKKRITLTSKIILFSTLFIWLGGSVFVFIGDQRLHSLGLDGIRHAMFQAMSAHTTVGFNSYDLSNLSLSSLFILILCMIIGASPSGTGGGIKTTSLTAIYSIVKAVYKRQNHITFFGKEIPSNNLFHALANLVSYLSVLTIAFYIILILEGQNYSLTDLLFESTSALSTVGMSTGITAGLGVPAKIVICTLMFIGRIGVLSIGFALIKKAPIMRSKPAIEDVAI